MTRVLSLCVESDRILGGRGECVLQLNARFPIVHQVCSDLIWDESPTWTVTVPHRVSAYEFDPGFPTSLLVNSEAYLVHCLELAKKWKPDVIHAHDWDMQAIARTLKRLTGIPWVAHFHLFQHEMMRAQGRPPTEQNLVPPTYERIGLLEADRVICVSNSMRRYAREAMGCEREIEVVHNGVTVDSIQPWRPEPDLLYIGRIDPQKGWEHVAGVAEIAPEMQVRIAGQIAAIPAAEAEKTEAMRYIRQLESRPNFRYLGHVPRSRRGSVYARSQFVVMPSNQEPFGIVALEAMARGIPLITTRVDGLSEFCTDQNSWKCEHSAESIADVVRECIRNPAEVSRRIRGGIETARFFSWDRTARETYKILQGANYGSIGTRTGAG